MVGRIIIGTIIGTIIGEAKNPEALLPGFLNFVRLPRTSLRPE
jgi:hypothetical protein